LGCDYMLGVRFQVHYLDGMFGVGAVSQYKELLEAGRYLT